MTKITSCALFLLLALLCFAGCAGQTPVPNEIVLISAEATDFTVIRPDEASDTAAAAAGQLRMAIVSECGDGTVGISTDYVGKKEVFPTDAKEILVGLTNREESAMAYALLPERPNNKKDYAIAYFGNKLALVGGSDEALADAAAYFAAHYLKDGTVTVPENLSYVYTHDYPTFTVGGISLAAYTVVYPARADERYKIAAEKLSALIDEKIGYALPIASDKDAQDLAHVIRILPASSDAGVYTAAVSGSTLALSGDPQAVEYAVSAYSRFAALFDGSEALTDGEILSENRLQVLQALSKPQNAPSPLADNTPYGRRAYAYSIIDDDNTRRGGLTSGWDYDTRGAGASQGYQTMIAQVNDVSGTEPAFLTRTLTTQKQGVVTLEMLFNCSGDGTFLALCDAVGRYALYLEFDQKALCIRTPDGALEKIGFKSTSADQLLKATLDFDAQSVKLYYDGTLLGSYPFADADAGVDMLRCGVTPEKQGSFIPLGVKMYANYLVCERFIGLEDTLPADLDIHSYNGELCAMRANGGMFGGNFDNKCLEADTDEFSLRKTFEKTSGKVAYELKFLLPERADGLCVGLTSAEQTALCVKTQHFGLFTGDNLLLKDYYSENVWHTLRIEADTETQKALIKLNGKSLGEVWFENPSAYIDGIFVTLKNEKSVHFYLDEIYAFAMPELADYVPEPVISEDSDVIVGINVCSLWREGTHAGWDKISAYDELKPLLGFYDEGVPEVMDWEIKWMTEHGIDFQLFCWYASSPNVPMMHTHLSDALMNGYMNARYSDKMKFALLWECANAAVPQSSEDFRRNFVPYMVEHFFSDERYMTVDGKALLAVFGANKLIAGLGGADACREELEYLDEICKGLGYEGVMMMVSTGSADGGTLTELKKAGFDAVYAYNWGKSGYDPAYTKSAINAQISKNILRVIPTLSTGFNNVGWAGTRSPNMEVSDYESMLRWFRDDLLDSGIRGSDESPFIMLSTWNEYGEGTYIMPSGLNGFGYLDALRSQFGNSTVPHEDVTPSKESLCRFSQMYEPSRAALEPLYRYTPELGGELYTGWYFDRAEDRKKWGAHFGLDDYSEGADCIRGESSKTDYAVKCTDMSGMDIVLDDIAYIKVTMDVSVRSTAQFFFLTEEDREWNGTKSLSALVGTESGRHEYIFSAKSVAGWTGKLVDLRLDPMDAPGSFVIYCIEFYKHDAEKLYIGSEPVKSEYGYEISENDIRLAVNPQTGILARLGLGWRWNKAEKALTLYNADASIRLTVGSATVYVGVADIYGFETGSGEPLTLDAPVGETDGLPVLSMRTLARVFGWQMRFDEQTQAFVIEP